MYGGLWSSSRTVSSGRHLLGLAPSDATALLTASWQTAMKCLLKCGRKPYKRCGRICMRDHRSEIVHSLIKCIRTTCQGGFPEMGEALDNEEVIAKEAKSKKLAKYRNRAAMAQKRPPPSPPPSPPPPPPPPLLHKCIEESTCTHLPLSSNAGLRIAAEAEH